MPSVKLLDPTDHQRRLDRYELIGELASGGMATVFLARLSGVGGFQRFVAIKRLHPHLANEPEFVEMFLDEARLAAGIHHPHVVPILEVGTSGSGYYLVMEYIEGDTLARIMARSFTGGAPVPRPILLRVILDSLAGLHAAHELNDGEGHFVGLVHRDVSPQNLLVGVDGSTRITDFGVARATARLSSTRAGKLKGKLAYMSPEQTEGGDIDRRADVFAMGIILWEVLAGRRLFKAESDAATLARLLHKQIPMVSSVCPEVPTAFDEVCARALDRSPTSRYQTAAELADALERAARRATATAAYEGSIASPRDVASYVQAVIGNEILAQRESVRAWIAQSEPSGITEISINSQVTVRIPLDRLSGAGPATRSDPGVHPMIDLDDDQDDAESLGDTLVGDRASKSSFPAPSLAAPSEVPVGTPRVWPPPIAEPVRNPPPAAGSPAQPRPVRTAPTLKGMPLPSAEPTPAPVPAPVFSVPVSMGAASTDPAPRVDLSFSESQNSEIIRLDLDGMATNRMAAIDGRQALRTLASQDGLQPTSQRVIPRTLASSSYAQPTDGALEDDIVLPVPTPWKRRYVVLAVLLGALVGGYVMWTVLAPTDEQTARGDVAEAPAVPVAKAPPPAEETAAPAPPEAPEEPAASAEPVAADVAPRKGTKGAKGAPKAEPTPPVEPPAATEPPPKKPPKKPEPGGDDLSNPYR